MLLLGVVQAQAIGVTPVVAAGSFDLLQSEVLTGSAASVTFSGLSAYASTYQHLQIRANGRISTSTNFTSAYMRLNGDSASNYSGHELVGNGSSVGSGGQANATEPYIWRVSGASAASGAFSAAVIDLLDPFETTKYKTIRSLSGGHYINAANPAIIQISSSSWRNTSSVTSLEFRSATGDFVSGTRISLYGVKKAA